MAVTARRLLAAGIALEAAAGVSAAWRPGASAGAPGTPSAPVAPVVPEAPAPAPAAGVGAPVRVEIPAIGVSAPVDALGLRPDGRVQVPGSPWRVGWYAGGSVPGEPGPAVLLGHVDSRTGPAVFYRLRRLRHGSDIVVRRDDGPLVRYVVTGTRRYAKKAFPTETVYGRSPDSTLRLVTCGGPYDGDYHDNVVVFARLSS